MACSIVRLLAAVVLAVVAVAPVAANRHDRGLVGNCSYLIDNSSTTNGLPMYGESASFRYL